MSSHSYFISNLHLGHKKILGFSPCREGKTVDEHDVWVISQICGSVTKRDHLYVLGDVAFDITKLELLNLIPCKKTLILGNHDKFQLQVYLKYFQKIHGFLSYKGFWLSHAPIHPDELRGRKNIHGHVHSQSIPDKNYINVCVEATNGVPLSFEEIREK